MALITIYVVHPLWSNLTHVPHSILELQETPPNFEALRELIEPEVLCASSSPIDIALDLEQACLVAALIRYNQLFIAM